MNLTYELERCGHILFPNEKFGHILLQKSTPQNTPIIFIYDLVDRDHFVPHGRFCGCYCQNQLPKTKRLRFNI